MKTKTKTSKEIISELNTDLYFSINTEDEEYMSLLIDAAEYQCKRIYEEEKNDNNERYEQLNYAHSLIIEWKKREKEDKNSQEYYYFILDLVNYLEC
jgi:hypothetical protein